MFSRYVSRDVANFLIESGIRENELMQHQRKSVVVLMSDVRNFTTMAESDNGRNIIKQLNTYHSRMTDCVFNLEGTLDKYAGDGEMAVFGNIKSYGAEEDAFRAIRAALAMRESLRLLNEEWEREGKMCFHFGVGINYGEAWIGDMGSVQRTEFSVIGDIPNIASRVQTLTKEFMVDIIITDEVYKLVSDRVSVNPLGPQFVKGKVHAITIYALIGLKEDLRT
jgi:adenylate cyclase